MSGDLSIDDLLVKSPQLEDIHVYQFFGISDGKDELSQGLHSKTSSQESLDGREARIVPTINNTLVNEPLKLPL